MALLEFIQLTLLRDTIFLITYDDTTMIINENAVVQAKDSKPITKGTYEDAALGISKTTLVGEAGSKVGSKPANNLYKMEINGDGLLVAPGSFSLESRLA